MNPAPREGRAPSGFASWSARLAWTRGPMVRPADHVTPRLKNPTAGLMTKGWPMASGSRASSSSGRDLAVAEVRDTGRAAGGGTSACSCRARWPRAGAVKPRLAATQPMAFSLLLRTRAWGSARRRSMAAVSVMAPGASRSPARGRPGSAPQVAGDRSRSDAEMVKRQGWVQEDHAGLPSSNTTSRGMPAYPQAFSMTCR